MAEYFPLLDRAVSGLTDPTAEARRSIYERARAALIDQLRRMDPPVPEEDIARETAALDEAIARVEAGLQGRLGSKTEPKAEGGDARRDQTPQTASRDATAPNAKSAAPRPRPPAPPRAAAPPPLPTGTAPPVAPPPSRERPVIGQRPPPSAAGSAPPLAVPPRPLSGAPDRAGPAARGARPVMAVRPVPPAPSSGTSSQQGQDTRSKDARPAGTRPQDTGPDDPKGLPTAAKLAVAATDPTTADPAAAEGSRDGASPADGSDADRDRADSPTPARARDGALRPLAPRPQQARRFSWPLAAVAILALVLVIGIGVAAYKMRDKPEQVVATRVDAPPSEAPPPGKTAERVGPAAANGGADTGDAASGDASSGAAVPVPVGQNGSDAGAAGPSIAVAQRAALLVDAPDEPQRVKTYVGTVLWHLDSVSPGQGQPLATAVKADVDIPDAKLKVTMLMQKNPEPQLPASHTIEFHFLPQPGNELGSVKQVNVPEMRKDDDAPTGDPLAGVPVAITDNYFLVGLSRGSAEAQNVRLITERNWFDMSLLFVSGKLGKLTFEKGAAGQRAFEEAFKAWH